MDNNGPKIKGKEISITRVVSAPIELVWEVWTQPGHIAQWWGPSGFTNTIHRMDVVAGGHWDFIMHGPDGTNYRNEIVYVEVEKPIRIVYDHGPSPKFRTRTERLSRFDTKSAYLIVFARSLILDSRSSSFALR